MSVPPNTAGGLIINIRSCFEASHNIAQGSKKENPLSPMHVYLVEFKLHPIVAISKFQTQKAP